MFEEEYRSQEQISREAAERSAIMSQSRRRKAEAKRVRKQNRRRFMRTEPVEAQ